MRIIEIWKDIEGYETYYQISSLGKIKSLDRYITDKNGKLRFKQGKDIISFTDNDGYLHVKLHKDGVGHTYTVHKLVARHFIERPSDFELVEYEVNHKDNNRTNNSFTNLEWITHADNIRYSVKSGNAHCLNMFGENNNNARKVSLYSHSMDLIQSFNCIVDCATYLIDNKISNAKSANQLACNISRVIDKDKKYINHYFKTA